MLVLERRDRLGGAATLERLFADQRFVCSPCAYVVGLLDPKVIAELGLRERGLRYWLADPDMRIPFEDGTSFAEWQDDTRTQASLEALGVSKADIDGYWAYNKLFRDIRIPRCATASGTRGRGTALPVRRSNRCSATTRRRSASSSRTRSRR